MYLHHHLIFELLELGELLPEQNEQVAGDACEFAIQDDFVPGKGLLERFAQCSLVEKKAKALEDATGEQDVRELSLHSQDEIVQLFTSCGSPGLGLCWLTLLVSAHVSGIPCRMDRTCFEVPMEPLHGLPLRSVHLELAHGHFVLVQLAAREHLVSDEHVGAAARPPLLEQHLVVVHAQLVRREARLTVLKPCLLTTSANSRAPAVRALLRRDKDVRV